MRIALCTACLSLPRYANVERVFPRVGCGQDCDACQAYMVGEQGAVIWLPEKDARLRVLVDSVSSKAVLPS